ncbi:MAG: hypothetical protein SPK28_00990, partial [Bacilli bacterium]|nr:hypothetical protein [Bacilli bacterium]
MDIKNKIDKLKNYISSFQTEDILGFISMLLMPSGSNGKEVADCADVFNKTSLMAPMKQYLYLAGLLVSNQYNYSNPKQLNNKEKKIIEKMLDEVTSEYSFNFLKDSISKLGINSFSINENFVSAFEYFDMYFNTGSLSYPEQTIDKIELLFRNFNEKICEIYGIGLDDFLSFYSFILDKQKESLEKMQSEMGKVMDLFEKKNESSSEQEVYEFLKKSNIDKDILADSISNVCCVNVNEIKTKFGIEKAKILCENFCIKRDKKNFTYYTDNNPFVQKPLVYVDDTRIFITFAPLLLDSIYWLLFDKFKDNPKFIKARGDSVEKKTIELFNRILPGCNIFQNVCEIPGSYEHDLLIEYKEYYFI